MRTWCFPCVLRNRRVAEQACCGAGSWRKPWLERKRPSWRTPTAVGAAIARGRSEEHTSELQSLMRISYAVFCLKKKKSKTTHSKPVRAGIVHNHKQRAKHAD